VTRNVLFLVILQKQNFINPRRGGGHMPRKRENSAKSRKIGMSLTVFMPQ